MPLYDYQCPTCKKVDIDVYHSMNSSGPTCDGCNTLMVKLPSLAHTDLKEFHKPIEMQSVACNSWEEIREIQQKCPDAEISDDPENELFGVPIARNRRAKMQVLRQVGYRENN